MFPNLEGSGDVVKSAEDTILEADRTRFTSPDPYIVLGVARDCDDATLKNAWRKLVKQYHSDKNDESLRWIFESVHAAYQKITGDSEERAAKRRLEEATEKFMKGEREESPHLKEALEKWMKWGK